MNKYILCLMLSAFGLMAQAQVAYLLPASSIESLPKETVNQVDQQPERNAATWFQKEYVQTGKGSFISLTDLLSIDTAQYKVLWVNVDRVDLGSLSGVGISTKEIDAIRAYVQSGGALYLSKQACHIAHAMGRMGYAPGWSNGGYTQGGDTWTLNAQIGIYPEFGRTFDRSSHPIFTDLNVLTSNNSYVYQNQTYFYNTYPMVGAVPRTDNNNMWVDMFRKDPQTGGKMEEREGYTHYSNTDPLRLEDFEADWNCKVLAVWGQVVDFCAPGIIEFLPSSTWKGKIITNGFAAYQWGTSNDQLNNVEHLTSNILAYLQGQIQPQPTPTPTGGDTIAYFPMEISGQYLYEKVTGRAMSAPCMATGPISVPGVIGSAWRLDGYSSYTSHTFTQEQQAALEGDSVTLSLWCAPQTYPMMHIDDAQNIMSSIAGNLNESAKTGFALRLSSQGDLRFEAFINGSRVSIAPSNKLPRGVWNHLVVTIDVPSKKAILYCNGSFLGQTTINGHLNAGRSNFYIGKPEENLKEFNCLINTFNGIIDEVVLANTVWTAQQIKQISQPYANQEVDLSIPREYMDKNILRPQFHGMPSSNWTNESHGFVYYNGKYHVFFQKNGNGPYMSRLHWGHISSTDLYTWKEEPIAIYPDQSYDIKGCWSGAIVTDNVLTNNIPWLMYTAVDNARASIRFAKPNDDTYNHFTKLTMPSIAQCPSGYDGDFRDPYFFRNGDNAYVIVGSGKNGLGTMVLFQWEGNNLTHKGEFFTGNNRNESGQFFEMSNVTKMGNKWLFTATPLGTAQGVRTIYWVGNIDANGKFVPDQANPRTVEFSGFAKEGYGLLSPSICQHDGKTIALGIVPDKLGVDDNRQMGWSHNYSLPREWTINDKGELEQKAYTGLQAFRSKDQQFILQDATINGTQTFGTVEGRELEVRAEFEVTYSDVGIKLATNNRGDGIRITFSPMQQQLEVDLTGVARKINDGGVFNGKYTTTFPSLIRPGETMIMHVFFDRSILDIFINDKWASSVRVFPTDANATGASFFTGESTKVKRLEAYVMKSLSQPVGWESVFPQKQTTPSAVKFLNDNGQLNIYKNGKVYSILGSSL